MSDPFNKVLLFLFLMPLYALYGAFCLLRDLFRLGGLVRRTRAALAQQIYCPNGHPNTVTARYECAACHGVYHGWVGRCSLCGAGASWVICAECGVSVPLPWEGR